MSQTSEKIEFIREDLAAAMKLKLDLNPANRLALLVRHAYEQPHAPHDPHRSCVTIAEAMAAWRDPLGTVKEAAADPVRFACRAAAREIGWRLFVKGGTALMMKTLNEASEIEEQAEGVINAWWNLIGYDADLWSS